MVIKDVAKRGKFRGSCRKLLFLFAPIILLGCDKLQPTNAILNCFTPNMFKMGKGGQQVGYGFERGSNWPYGSQNFGPSSYGGQMNHMKMLFQPKWRTGGLFGGKGWNSWKMGANSNFYRPGYGYGGSASGLTGGYPIGEQQLSVAPFAPPNPFSSYSPSNEGWSVPISYNQVGAVSQIQQTSLNNYDGYSPTLPAKLQTVTTATDSYGGTKGGNLNKITNNKYSTTKNNLLLADGGYDAFDANFANYGTKNQSYGYSYPDWYSSSVDSPAKIAQNLIKYGGFKRLRQQELHKSAPLIQNSGSVSLASSSAKFTILDEPRFVGYGTVDISSSKEAKLSCSFGEPIDQTNRPLWIKFQGPYNSSQISNGRLVPPFNCVNSLCRTQEIESTKDYRYRFDTGPATSTLIISEPRLADYGTYRCSALTKAINNNPLETIYQVIQFGVLS